MVVAEEVAEVKVEVKAEEAVEAVEKAEEDVEHKEAEEDVVRGDQELLTTTTQRRRQREIVSQVLVEPVEILMVGMLGTGWKGSLSARFYRFYNSLPLWKHRAFLFDDRSID